jgi:hypothetical protein
MPGLSRFRRVAACIWRSANQSAGGVSSAGAWVEVDSPANPVVPVRFQSVSVLYRQAMPGLGPSTASTAAAPAATGTAASPAAACAAASERNFPTAEFNHARPFEGCLRHLTMRRYQRVA